ncbi:MAG: ABC transporter ATP-binding protein [Alphaproteobacteria bacterium]|nr:ABC transporter ATP-binding protein [Alphaproteobacteria bacterium]MBU1561835.1 ABC transporter ATP-binding protein [Alphaproteobacteria bacterium]MBU2304567.1 ABC transporter ATP-binding protein [Alphaproteobacteria bacterium]MBU2368101.1 ABC transporter ATP-binding protein [Alphaproteobacteria bacterium]
MDGPLVEVHDLTKDYEEGDNVARVLKGVQLEVARGELVALLGPSGSGKSTLLNILGTLMRPTAGSVRILGQSLVGADDFVLTEFRNRHIGFVFQAHLLLPDFTALENVMFPAAARHGRERREDRARGSELLDRVGLSDRRDYLASQLSGGQKQRVAVARSLMNAPELVLADEPTGNLDRESADRVMQLLTEINTSDGTGFLISTHDEKIAARCRRQIYMVDGKIAHDSR